MKKVRITVVKVACYKDLMEKYENPIEHACEMKEGQVFIANGYEKPNGFCDSAWKTISEFVLLLSQAFVLIFSSVSASRIVSSSRMIRAQSKFTQR